MDSRILKLTSLLTWSWLVSCSDGTDFAGPSNSQAATPRDLGSGGDDDGDAVGDEYDSDKDGDGENDFDANKRRASQLTWFWQCESAPVPVPAPASPNEIVIAGAGPHQFSPKQLDGAPLVFTGKICEPEEFKRDIVFVIDTSGSMNENDPRVGDSCGRLTAIDTVVRSLVPGSFRVGLVTFNGALDRFSTGLFESADALFSNLAGTGKLADVVCNANSGTNYDAGLSKAAELFQTAGQTKATKEVYFVSDGQPNFGVEGIAQANLLKTNGVNIGGQMQPLTIATIMLSGTDTVLERFIASQGPNGKPLHAYVAQTSELTKALSILVKNEVAAAQLAWRPIGSADWQKSDLLQNLQGFNFTLPSVTINYEEARQGLEVLYEYFDKHNARFVTEGKLLWDAVASEENEED